MPAMKRKKPTETSATAPMECDSDWPVSNCQCAELGDAITELSRQVHLLGRIIDELVSEFHWQNNQMAEYIRQADRAAEGPVPIATPAGEPSQTRRTKLFD